MGWRFLGKPSTGVQVWPRSRDVANPDWVLVRRVVPSEQKTRTGEAPKKLPPAPMLVETSGGSDSTRHMWPESSEMAAVAPVGRAAPAPPGMPEWTTRDGFRQAMSRELVLVKRGFSCMPDLGEA